MVRLLKLSFVLHLLCSGSLSLMVACAGDNPSTIVFVDANAGPGGDGSTERPFQTVREALEVDRVVTMIAIEGGTYEVPSWTFEAPVIIQGSLRAPTVLTAEAGADRIVWDATAGAGLLLVRELGFTSALQFSTGEIELRTVTMSGATGPAIHFVNASAAMVGVDVSDVMEVAQQPLTGDGVLVEGGSFSWARGSVAGAPDRGLIVRAALATLDNLTLHSRDRGALTVEDAADVTAGNVRISDLRTAIVVSGASLNLDAATISGAQSSGLLISPNSTVSVTNSSFSDCPQGHVAQIGSGTDMTLDGNQFTNASDSTCVGLSAQGVGTFVVRNNVIDTCAGNGISFSYGTGLVIEDNTIRNILPDPFFPTLGEGITVIDASGTISRNNISNTVGDGILLIRAVVTVDSNVITDTGSAAISRVEQSASRTTITNNTISLATGVGVLILDATADVSGNEISQTALDMSTASGDGIAFAIGADVNVIANISSNNATNGIVFLDGATGEVRDNTATGNNQYGIFAPCSGAATSVTVGTNQLSGNTLGAQSLCP